MSTRQNKFKKTIVQHGDSNSRQCIMCLKIAKKIEFKYYIFTIKRM